MRMGVKEMSNMHPGGDLYILKQNEAEVLWLRKIFSFIGTFRISMSINLFSIDIFGHKCRQVSLASFCYRKANCSLQDVKD
jgi:hypothetical protein